MLPRHEGVIKEEVFAPAFIEGTSRICYMKNSIIERKKQMDRICDNVLKRKDFEVYHSIAGFFV